MFKKILLNIVVVPIAAFTALIAVFSVTMYYFFGVFLAKKKTPIEAKQYIKSLEDHTKAYEYSEATGKDITASEGPLMWLMDPVLKVAQSIIMHYHNKQILLAKEINGIR